MKQLVFVVCIFLGMGCSAQTDGHDHTLVTDGTTTLTISTSPATTSGTWEGFKVNQHPKEHPALVALRAETKRRGIRWMIHCDSTQDGKFFAWAVQPGGEFSPYVEDGKKGSWVVNLAPSQLSAVRQLRALLRKPPNSYPTLHRHKCPPAVYSWDYPE